MDRRRQNLALGGSAGALALVAVLIGFVMAGAPEDPDTGPTTSAGVGAAPAESPAAEGDTSGGAGSDGSPGNGGDTGDAGDGGEDGSEHLPAQGCAASGFRVGDWRERQDGDPGTVSGISASGNDECVRLRVSFDGPAPGVRVWRPSAANHSSVNLLAGDAAEGEAPGPVTPDLLWPELDLLSAAMLTSDGTGLAVKAIHGSHTDVAARLALAPEHVDIYFRPAHPDDPREHDRWQGGPRHVQVTGVPEDGLAVLHVAGYDDDEGPGGWVRVEGYARAPESNVVLRVYEADGDGLICERPLLALGPPYLLSWFGDACAVPRDGAYDVQLGWSDPAGPDRDVWRWYEVTVG